MNKICGIPFSEIRLYPHPYNTNRLTLMCCCPSWLDVPYNEFTYCVPETPSGHLKIDEVWNSERMIKLRKSVVEGTYTFCKLDRCASYISNDIIPPPKRALELIEKGIYEMDYPPITIHSAIDRACNLRCPTCRLRLNPLPNVKTENWLESILKSGIECINFNGSGEAFKNPYFLGFMINFKKENFPNLKKVDIITNGTLLNYVMWMSLSDDFKSILDTIMVSVDAATESTYKKVRLGGNFQTVLKNLKFLGNLRRKGEIKKLSLAFVIQKINRHELYDFSKMAIEIGATSVSATRVEDWSHYTLGEFYERFELPESYLATYKEDFLKIKDLLKKEGLSFYSNLE